MGALDKFLNYMKLNDGNEYDDEDDYYDEDEEIEAPAPKKSHFNHDSNVGDEKTNKKAPINKIAPIQSRSTTKRVVNTTDMEVCVIKPTTIEDAREITETLLANRPVVLNLEGLDVEIAQRIIDFTSGSCFAIRGNLQKISHYIFIITPSTVDISGDFQDIFGGAFNSPINTDL